MSQKKYEEYAYVLDYLPYGRPEETKPFKRGPLVQLVGESYFTLLEATPIPGVALQPGQKVYIGKGPRGEIEHIERRISYEELTPAAKDELPRIVERIVEEDEARFVEFFNKAGPITTRMHALELLPGIGKKGMWKIVEERKKAPFKSFEEIQQRTKIPDPKRMVVKRILSEIMEEDKYYIFTKPPSRQRF